MVTDGNLYALSAADDSERGPQPDPRSRPRLPAACSRLPAPRGGPLRRIAVQHHPVDATAEEVADAINSRPAAQTGGITASVIEGRLFLQTAEANPFRRY